LDIKISSLKTWCYYFLIPIYIVLRLGPIQGSGFRFWLSHRVSSVFLNQNDVVLVKKQKSTGLQPDLDQGFPGYSGRQVTSSFFFPCFFFNPAQFQSRLAKSWVNQLGRAIFQNHASIYTSYGSMTRFKTGYLVALCPHQLNQTGKK
jgi:hypothetical protein